MAPYRDISLLDLKSSEICIHAKSRRNQGVGALFVEMGFYTDISWESKCKIEINISADFYKILLVFEVPYQPRLKGMPGKS